jgi:hypothetical protein
VGIEQSEEVILGQVDLWGHESKGSAKPDNSSRAWVAGRVLCVCRVSCVVCTFLLRSRWVMMDGTAAVSALSPPERRQGMARSARAVSSGSFRTSVTVSAVSLLQPGQHRRRY